MRGVVGGGSGGSVVHYCNTPRLEGGAAGRGRIGWGSWGVVVLVGMGFCF